MQLKEFLKDTISQIGSAVKELNKEDNGIIVNPANSSSSDLIIRGSYGYMSTRLNFHLELAVNEHNSANASVGVFANIIGIGGKIEQNEKSTSNSSVDFSLVVLLPQG